MDTENNYKIFTFDDESYIRQSIKSYLEDYGFTVVDALRLGAWDYILKPIEDMNALYYPVKKCLKESQIRRENKKYQERLEELVKERTEELQQSEERYKAVFEYTGTAAILLDLDDTILMVNSKFCEMAGMDRGDIEGKKKWFDFVAPDDIEVLQNYIAHELDDVSGKNSPMQYEITFLGHGKMKNMCM